MTTVDILGVPHAYDLTAPKSSSSPVLVFIHGWLLSRRYWQPLIEKLAPDYQCLAYDLRGFGNSQPQDDSALRRPQQQAELFIKGQQQPAGADSIRPSENIFSLECSSYAPVAYARDLEMLLEAMNIDSAWLIGHSLGGTIALWAAAQMPHRVKGVICMNSGGGIYLKEAFERFRSAGEQLVKRRPRWLCHLPGLDLLFARMNVVRPIPRCWGRQRIIDFAIAHPEAALGAMLDSTTEAEVNRLPHIVSKLQQPVYFIAGAEDELMEPKYVRHLASFHYLFQNCIDNVIEIPCCGHLAMLEQTEAVADRIRFLIRPLAE